MFRRLDISARRNDGLRANGQIDARVGLLVGADAVKPIGFVRADVLGRLEAVERLQIDVVGKFLLRLEFDAFAAACRFPARRDGRK